MRRALTLTLLLAVAVVQMGSRWVVYAAWKANQAYIAAELCENRDRPELGCEGQCCLKRELKKQEAQERKAPRPVMPEFAAAPMPEPVRLAAVLPQAAAGQADRAYPPFAVGKPSGCALSWWQPPGV